MVRTDPKNRCRLHFQDALRAFRAGRERRIATGLGTPLRDHFN
jgi:hypothetical protein